MENAKMADRMHVHRSRLCLGRGPACITEDGRVARVVRALCAADGHDPEEPIHVGSETVEADGVEHYREVVAPAWTTYTSEALRFVAAMRAMGPLE